MTADPTTLGVVVAILAETRWAISRLDRRLSELEEKPKAKGRKSGSVARVVLWFGAISLLLTGCGPAARAALAPEVPAQASPVLAVVLNVAVWSAGMLAVGMIACAILAVVLKDWRYLLGSVAAAAGVACCYAMEWLAPVLPWLVLAAVVVGAGVLVWEIYRHQLAVRLAAAHGDRLESLQATPDPSPVELAAAKLTAAKEQAAAGVHRVIARARRKLIKKG